MKARNILGGMYGFGLAGAGGIIGLGHLGDVGGSAASGITGSTATGISRFGSFMPTIGRLGGVGMTLGLTRDLVHTSKKIGGIW